MWIFRGRDAFRLPSFSKVWHDLPDEKKIQSRHSWMQNESVRVARLHRSASSYGIHSRS